MMKPLMWLACLSVLGGCAMTSTVPSDVVKDLAPTGKLRAAINFGNPVLAQKNPATGEARGNEFEVRTALARNSGDLTMGPTIRSWALRVQPVSPMIEEILVPLRIGPTLTRADGVVENVDSVAQIENVSTLCGTKEVVSYAEGDRAWTVIVADYEFDEQKIWVGQDTPLGVKGTCVIRLKTVS